VAALDPFGAVAPADGLRFCVVLTT